ncbi:MAG: hypothetical protein QXK06_04690 [Candidatus Diapherotrites archaeon]
MPLLPKYGSSEAKRVKVQTEENEKDDSPLRTLAERGLAKSSSSEPKKQETPKKGFFARFFGKKE